LPSESELDNKRKLEEPTPQVFQPKKFQKITETSIIKDDSLIKVAQNEAVPKRLPWLQKRAQKPPQTPQNGFQFPKVPITPSKLSKEDEDFLLSWTQT
jgi:hypothetical protein